MGSQSTRDFTMAPIWQSNSILITLVTSSAVSASYSTPTVPTKSESSLASAMASGS